MVYEDEIHNIFGDVDNVDVINKIIASVAIFGEKDTIVRADTAGIIDKSHQETKKRVDKELHEK